MTKFYDTCSLILDADNLFRNSDEHFIISSITLDELENIKSSSKTSVDNKIAVAQLLHKLDEHIGGYEVHVFKEGMLNPIHEEDLSVSNDMKILATAINYNELYPNELLFITNDLSLKTIARLFLEDEQITSITIEEDNYTGYTIKQFETNEEMEYFYSHYFSEKVFNDLLVNEYLILKNPEGQEIDRLVWTADNRYRALDFKVFDSKQFGRIKPLDTQQQLLADSLYHNKLTMVRGPAGSGKSCVSLAFLFNQLEHNRIDKIIVFCNTLAAKGAAKLGFYPGSREEKLLDSQIGNFLSSKLGSKICLEQLLSNEQIILLPMADIRGYDTTGMRAGIYITEAQNMDIDLMKLALQRIGEDSICILDGDSQSQVDDPTFAGIHNGMRRVSQVFRGQDFYGEITLQKIHRGRISQIAQFL